MCKVDCCQWEWKSGFVWIFVEEAFILKHNFKHEIIHLILEFDDNLSQVLILTAEEQVVLQRSS